DVKNCWIPDVFGYSASMPQILKLCGLEHFLTQKMSWSQFNRFPYSTFRWRGIDGTEVLTHFPPEDTYNSQLQPYDLQKTERNFVEKGVLDEMMCLFGVGDGGGGPTAEMIERGLRQKNLEGVPKVRFGRADEFFQRISKKSEELPVWSGELYLELHRGTLTTQARTKRNNRMLEQSLRATEYLLSMGPLQDYPQQELDKIWKTLLINQFHDILPGSSIHWVYEVTEREHQDALEICERLRSESTEQLFDQDKDAITLINTLNVAYERQIELPEDWKGGLQDEHGNDHPVQQDTDGKLSALVRLEPQEIKTLRSSNATLQAKKADSLILENQLVRYEFNQHAQLVAALDLETGESILADGEVGNILTLYEDRPHNWDAWEIDISYEDMAVETAQSQTWQSLGAGPVSQSLLFQLKIGNSKIDQRITLQTNSKGLEFNTKVDWQECHRMLRTAFPVNVQADSATCDIQYGHVQRPTHRNTTWDMARFEVAAQKYVDLSDHQRGVALLNDCKYGHKLHENILDLHLLRAPTYPDPDADLGNHQFCYVLYPHNSPFQQSDVIEQAQQFNQAPLSMQGIPISHIQPPVIVEGEDVGLEVLKKAEKENCLILRIVERKGRNSEATIRLTDSNQKLKSTDLMEWIDSGETVGGELKLTLKPFEIKTFKITQSS
ncbi:MAG: alpha-mannosidase 2c1, partial [Euryarchaeota archaeon]|nr:alpha-mannosidase 2c1 [Euryarchaeota archaeon]